MLVKLEYEPWSAALALGTVGPALNVLLCCLVIGDVFARLVSAEARACLPSTFLSLLRCNALLGLPHHLRTERAFLQAYIPKPVKRDLLSRKRSSNAVSFEDLARQGSDSTLLRSACCCSVHWQHRACYDTVRKYVRPTSSTSAHRGAACHTRMIRMCRPRQVGSENAQPDVPTFERAAFGDPSSNRLKLVLNLFEADRRSRNAPASAAARPPSLCWPRSSLRAPPASLPPPAPPAASAPRRAPCRCSGSSPAAHRHTGTVCIDLLCSS